jgi:phospholipid transport system substrate-binding protein
MLMRTYAEALRSYEDQPIRVMRPTSGYFDWDKAVPTEIVLKDGKPIQAKYYLYRNPQGEWKVYDVVVENISFIMSYRNVLQEDARRLGWDGLIEKMRTQTIPVAKPNVQKS